MIQYFPKTRVSADFDCLRSCPRRWSNGLSAFVICELAIAMMLMLDLSLVRAESVDRPNIVLFLADDLGWNGLQCYGSDLYETPHLDALAAAGVKFSAAYSACTVCSPSRAAIMTGKYPARLHLTDFIAGQNQPFAKLSIPDWTKHLLQEEVTIAEAMHELGYKTAQLGKWHLSPRGDRGVGYQPTDQGFDVQITKPASKGYFLTKPAGAFQKGDFTTDYFAAEAAGVIERWKDDPFFLYFAFEVPHTPIEGKQALVDQFAAKVRPDAIHNNPTYAAMVRSMDDAVGTVLRSLRQNGIDQKTVVIFTSDNGGLTHRHREPTGFTRNDPLRRGKGSAYEGGTRVPMIVHWPGVTPANAICDQPVIGADLFPTVLQIATAETEHPAAPLMAQDIDGKSLVALLKDPSAILDRAAIYWHYPHYHAGGFALPGERANGPYSAIRQGKWKLIEYFEDDRVELYDLESDIRESHDLASELPAIASELRQSLHDWRVSVDAQLPTANPKHDPGKSPVDNVSGVAE